VWSVIFCFVESSKPDSKKMGPSFFERLLGNVLKNFEVNITNIHVRYEDMRTMKTGVSFAAGLTLKEFSVHVCTAGYYSS